MLSKKTKYGLHAVIYLAKHAARGAVLISDLAKEERMPRKFLEAILLELKKNGILTSKKGKGGGYSLRGKPQEITMGEIIRVLEGPLAPVSCVSQTAYKHCDDCVDENTCGIRQVMKKVRAAIANILDKTTVQDVLDDTHYEQKGILNYHI